MQAVELAYQELANAIVVQAVNDYRAILRGKNPYGRDCLKFKPNDKAIAKLEKFFRSSWYRMLTKVDGEFLIEELRKEYQEEQKRSKNEQEKAD